MQIVFYSRIKKTAQFERPFIFR